MMANINHIGICPTCGGPLKAGLMFCSRTCRRPSELTRERLRAAKKLNPPCGMLGKHHAPKFAKKMAEIARSKIVGMESWVASRREQSSGMTVRLFASEAGGGCFTLIDAEDAGFLSQFSWHVQADRAGTLRVTTANRCGLFGSAKVVAISRIVVMAPAGFQVDHINGDSLDNRKCNLRLATHTENQRNKGANKNSKTGFKGVAPKRNRFSAQIHVGAKKVNLGVYDTPEEAARAYDKAAREIHGEFARTNF